MGSPRWARDLYASPPTPLLLILGPIVLLHVVVEQFRRWWRGAPKYLPPCADELLKQPATALASKIRRGELTSRELTDRCIARLEQIEPQLNALVGERFAEARADADAADAAVRAGTVPASAPLWGVPVVVKECFEVRGQPFTAGVVYRRGRIGVENSPPVARLQAAGCVLVGVTNTSEACMFHESANPVFGRSCNPHDLGRTPGGSSGGAAAVVGACGTPLAVTSDVGGSTRIPAFYCGLFGHKPTGGTIPNTRTLPRLSLADSISRYCQLGPTTRHAADLYPLLQVIAGPDGIDASVRPDASERLLRRGPADVDVKSLTVYSFEEPFMPWPLRCGLHPDVRDAHRATAAALRRIGCRVVPIGRAELPETAMAFSIWAALMSSSGQEPFIETLSDGRSTPLTNLGALWELACCVPTGASARHTAPGAGLALVEQIEKLSPLGGYMKAKGARLRRRLDGLLADGSAVLLVPPPLTPAPRHHENLARFTNSAQTSLFNVMELPATAVPTGLSADGLPVGVQIVGGFGHDEVTIAVALALEAAGAARAA